MRTVIAMAKTAIPPTTPPAMAPEFDFCCVEALAAWPAAVSEIGAAVVGVEVVLTDEVALADAEIEDKTAEDIEVDFVVADEDGVLWLEDGVFWLEDDILDRNGAAISGFDERKPAVRSPTGQPPC